MFGLLWLYMLDFDVVLSMSGLHYFCVLLIVEPYMAILSFGYVGESLNNNLILP